MVGRSSLLQCKKRKEKGKEVHGWEMQPYAMQNDLSDRGMIGWDRMWFNAALQPCAVVHISRRMAFYLSEMEYVQARAKLAGAQAMVSVAKITSCESGIRSSVRHRDLWLVTFMIFSSMQAKRAMFNAATQTACCSCNSKEAGARGGSLMDDHQT
eukprot:scaffold6044_cov16-Tisochrysis_lutea.AAC.1